MIADAAGTTLEVLASLVLLAILVVLVLAISAVLRRSEGVHLDAEVNARREPMNLKEKPE